MRHLPKPRFRWTAVLRLAACCAALGFPAALGAQRLPVASTVAKAPRNAREVMPPMLHPGASRDLNMRLRAFCSGLPTDRSALLKAELRLNDLSSAKGAGSGEWAALACARAVLDADGAIAHDGALMVSGSTWADGAMAAAHESLRLDPKNAQAAEVLGQVSLDEIDPGSLTRHLSAITTSLSAGTVTPALLRACDEFAIRADSMRLAGECTERALSLGLDSTWHLIRLARERHRAADAASGNAAFLEAVGAAHSDDAFDEVSWHVQWFLTPEEEKAWEKVPANLRRSWLHDRMATRDVRDGRPAGSRLAEHFERLDTVLKEFTLHVARVYVKKGMTGVEPENQLPPETIQHWIEPGVVPAYPIRFYHRWQQQIDDRGVVWMRFGPPSKRIVAHPVDTVTTEFHASVREVWVYNIDGQKMLLHFEGEDLDGNNGATRLVTRVLGSYLCDVDVRRCLLTMKSQGPGAGVNPEELEQLRQQDQEALVIATTKDDNSVRVEHNIETLAQLHRLWDVTDGSPIALVTYALKVGDLASADGAQGRLASIGFDIRQHDPATDGSETSFTRRLILPDTAAKKSHLTGFAVVPSSVGVTTWSLIASQGTDRLGRAFEEGKSPLLAGRLMLSDLVLGAESQGVTWNRDGQQVFLAPLGVMSVKDAIHLYYQIRSDSSRAGVTTSVVLTRTDQGPKAASTPVLQITFTGELPSGLSEVERQLDVSHLGSGSYRLEVIVTDRGGAVRAKQSARLLLR